VTQQQQRQHQQQRQLVTLGPQQHHQQQKQQRPTAAVAWRQQAAAVKQAGTTDGNSADCTAVVTPFASEAVQSAAKHTDTSTMQLPSYCHQPALQPFSAGVTAAGVLVAGAVISGLCLLVRLGVLIPLGVPLGTWNRFGVQFQPTYLPQYAAAFVLGLMAHRAPEGLQRLPACAGPAAAAVAAVLAVIGGVIMSVFPGTNFGKGLSAEPSVAYAAVYTVWEQFYAVAVWLAMLVCYRECLNRKGGEAGAAVSGASYAVYVTHVPVVTAFGLAFSAVALPVAAKCAVVSLLAVVSAWIIGMLLKQIPGVKYVL